MDDDLRTLLATKAEEMRIDARIPGPVLRRARRRRAATAAVAAIVAVGVGLGAIAGVRTLLERVPTRQPREAAVGAPATADAPIYPATGEQIRLIQEQVAQGSMPLWTDPEGAALLFAVNVLGWDMNDVAADVRGDDPVTVIITNSRLNRQVSPGADIRTAVALRLVEGEPGPNDDIYVVTSTYAEDVELDSPQPGEPIVPGSDTVFSGRLVRDIPGATVEASLTWEDRGGGAGSAGAPPPGGTRRFEITMGIPADVTSVPIAAATVHAASGEALAQTAFRLGAPQGTTTLEAAPPVEVQPLPEAVERTREAILAAAQARDWEALRALIPYEGFTFSYGGEQDPIAYWRRLESRGHLPVIGDILPAVLATEHGRYRGVYIWPGPAAEDPATWDGHDLAVLRRIHAEEDIRLFQETGLYTGWRLEIGSDGTWLSFVAGD